jgi:hypothetical protein
MRTIDIPSINGAISQRDPGWRRKNGNYYR